MSESGRQESKRSTASSQRETDNLHLPQGDILSRAPSLNDLNAVMDTGLGQRRRKNGHSTSTDVSHNSRVLSVVSASGAGPFSRTNNLEPGTPTAIDQTNRFFKVSMSYLSIGIEPLFALFLAMAIQQATPVLLGLAHVSEEVGEDAGWFLAIALGICNLVSDVLFFNAVTEALSAASASIDSQLQPLVANGTIVEAKADWIKFAASVLRWAALVLCWPVGAGADGVALTAFTSNSYISIPLALAITGLGMYYYHMGYGSQIDKHTIGAALHRQEGLAQMRAHPNKAIELVTKAGINNLSRGLTFGYILYALATDILHTNENNITLALFVAAIIVVNTFMSGMTRTLPCYQEIFGIPLDQYDSPTQPNDIIRIRSNPSFEHNGYAPLTISKTIDMIMSFIRAAPVVYLMLRDSQHPALIAAAAIVGAAFFIQSYTARINISADNAAYKILKAEQAPAVAAAPFAGLADLGGVDPMANFNSRVETAKANPVVKGIALFASTGGRLARLVASYWFVAELFGLFADHGWLPKLSDLDFLMLDLLIFTPPAEADAPLFNNANWKTLAEHIVRAHFARNAETKLDAISAFLGCTNEELAGLRAGGLRESLVDGSRSSSVFSNVVGNHGDVDTINPIFGHSAGLTQYSPSCAPGSEGDTANPLHDADGLEYDEGGSGTSQQRRSEDGVGNPMHDDAEQVRPSSPGGFV
jgi:hypothetical protein